MPIRRRAALLLLLVPFIAAGCARGLAASRPVAGVAPTPAAGAGSGAGAATAPTTVTGILIDTHCYSLDRSHATDDHKTPNGTIEGCAEACAKLGIPVGVLTPSGDVVVLLAPSPDLADHMGREARAVGRRSLGNSLRPDSVFVREDNGAWAPVPLHQMM